MSSQFVFNLKEHNKKSESNINMIINISQIYVSRVSAGPTGECHHIVSSLTVYILKTDDN